jgi:hypothetical protein
MVSPDSSTESRGDSRSQRPVEIELRRNTSKQGFDVLPSWEEVGKRSKLLPTFSQLKTDSWEKLGKELGKLIRMSGVPYRSKLSRYEAEIVSLRGQRPPVPYQKIVLLLKERHGIETSINAVFTFLKIRNRWNRNHRQTHLRTADSTAGCELEKNAPAGTSPTSSGSAMKTSWGAIERLREETNVRTHSSKKRLLTTFTPSNQYNLTRLTPEEAEAYLRKLAQEGD